jgi:hypothetical protein
MQSTPGWPVIQKLAATPDMAHKSALSHSLYRCLYAVFAGPGWRLVCLPTNTQHFRVDLALTPKHPRGRRRRALVAAQFGDQRDRPVVDPGHRRSASIPFVVPAQQPAGASGQVSAMSALR